MKAQPLFDIFLFEVIYLPHSSGGRNLCLYNIVMFILLDLSQADSQLQSVDLFQNVDATLAASVGYSCVR